MLTRKPNLLFSALGAILALGVAATNLEAAPRDHAKWKPPGHSKWKPPGHAKGKTLQIQEQGAYAYGGTILGDPASSSLNCDHGYVEYQIPRNPRKVGLLMWHSSSTKTWDTTFDGRDGFKNIFLRRDFPVYIVDGPRIGRAGWGCAEWTYTPQVGRSQATIASFRLGVWNPPSPPEFFPGVQFPTDDPEALDQLLRGRYPEFNDFEDAVLEAGETAKLADDVGPVVILSHSGSGNRGFLTRLKSDKVVGIVAYEPTEMLFPPGQAPAGQPEVSMEEFLKLTQIPIQIVWGDNVDKVASWAARLDASRVFVELVNAQGGDAEVLHLPEIGITGNTHFPMSDLNNVQNANLLSHWLREKRLDRK
jgi:hypothetical protein